MDCCNPAEPDIMTSPATFLIPYFIPSQTSPLSPPPPRPAPSRRPFPPSHSRRTQLSRSPLTTHPVCDLRPPRRLEPRALASAYVRQPRVLTTVSTLQPRNPTRISTRSSRTVPPWTSFSAATLLPAAPLTAAVATKNTSLVRPMLSWFTDPTCGSPSSSTTMTRGTSAASASSPPTAGRR